VSELPTFLGEPPASESASRLYESDRASDGYVGNSTRLWSWRPEIHESFLALRRSLMSASTLTDREWALLVTSSVAELGDSYCALAWGSRLAELSDDETAAQVIAGAVAPALSHRERVLAAWARRVARDPNATTRDDVDELRAAGLDDQAIFDATAFVAFRLAFSTVNDALGAAPDRELADRAPAAVRAAVTRGRRPTE